MSIEQMWEAVEKKLTEENIEETAEFFGVDEIIFPEWKDLNEM